jgi:twitching motility protein PilJ
MSVVDKLQNLFTKKQSESEMDSRLSLAMPEDSSGAVGGETLQEDVAPAAALRGAPVKELDDNPPKADTGDLVSIPGLGSRTVVQQQRTLFVLGGAALLVLVGVAIYAVNQSDKVAQQLGATGQALMQSQRLAKSVSQAVVGSAQAFPDVSDSADVLSKTTRGLQDGDDALKLKPLGDNYVHELEKIMPLVDRAEKSAKAVMGQQKILTQIGSALRLINRQSSDLLEIAEAILAMKLQQNAPSVEISAVGQLVMLTQRIGKSSNEFLTAEGVSPEAVFLLGKDLNTFKEISQGLLSGSQELRLAASKDAGTREQLDALIKMYEETRVQASAILGNLQGLVSAREAQDAIIADSEPLRRNLEEVQAELQTQTGIGGGPSRSCCWQQPLHWLARVACPMFSCKIVAGARLWPKTSGLKPNARSTKRSG